MVPSLKETNHLLPGKLISLDPFTLKDILHSYCTDAYSRNGCDF